MCSAYATSAGGGARVLLVVPPFAPLFQGSLACHLLQACARADSTDVTVLYANLKFASLIGHEQYQELLEHRVRLEHVFRTAAFGTTVDTSGVAQPLQDAAAEVENLLEWFSDQLRELEPSIVGATCSFEQISASLAFLRRCKQVDDSTTTLIGGANCEGEMAEGILSLGDSADHIVSGEAEQAFPALIRALDAGEVPARIIQGEPCADLDELPAPRYEEYFSQVQSFFPEDGFGGRSLGVPYESSRGCWWGVKHHCTFCGLNGEALTFREKSPNLVAEQMGKLLATYPVDRINAVDNIMPHSYFSTLLPQLEADLPDSSTIFYEQKSNIELRRAIALKAAHIDAIQPGIEALSSNVLACMQKGVRAHQNVALLRYGRSLGIDITWNLLAGFPGDRPEDYEATSRLVALIPHLQPPDGLGYVRIDRFSPYFERPGDFGIRNLRPKPIYGEVFPPRADVDKLAYYFDGDYECGAFECPEIMDRLAQQVVDWRARWALRPRPFLRLIRLAAEQFVMVDNRAEPGEQRFEVVERDVARFLLAGASLKQRYELQWAIDRGFLIDLDQRLVPLATASEDILIELVGEASSEQRQLQGNETMLQIRSRQ